MLIKQLFRGTLLLATLVAICIWNSMKVHISPAYGYDNRCGFKAWKDGAVTVLQPRIAMNYSKLFGGDVEEVNRVSAETAKWKNSLSDHGLLERTMSCYWVRYYFINNLYITELERSFPVAFLFLVHNSPQQVLRLLKVVYRPHNQYCIIPDLKSSPHLIDIFRNIAACLSNVKIASKLVSVRWGHHSIMDSQIICFRELLALRARQSEQSKWKYVINLCGKELPLATSHEIVSRLMQLKGSSAIYPELVKKNDSISNKRLRGKVPFNLPYYKSSTYMGLSYEFLNFLFTNSTAIKVRQFFEPCDIPEEHFYAVMAAIPGVPGGFNPKVPTMSINYCNWQYKGPGHCIGKIVHDICIPKIGGLRRIMRDTENGTNAMFYNKYFMEYDHTLMDCMEEELIAKNKGEFDDDGRPEDADGCIYINSTSHLDSRYVLPLL